MLIYFTRRLYIAFTAFFLSLLCILAFGDLLVRLTILPSLYAIPKIVYLMLPIISVIAIPLSSALASCSVYGMLYSDNEIVLLSFLPRAKRSFFKAVFVFSLLLSILYGYIVFNLAPKSYFEGKQFLVTLAQDRLTKLESGVFHDLATQGVFYFQDKEDSDQIVYKKVLLMYRDEKSNSNYTIMAKEATLGHGVIHLVDGTMETEKGDKSYVATFKTSDINIDQIVSSVKDEVKNRDSKYLGFRDLYRYKRYKEIHFRISQVLWQIILPIISLIGLMMLAQIGTNNLFLSICSASVAFILSYASSSIGKGLYSSFALSIGVLYGTPLLVALIWVIIFMRQN